jgi:pimeloyl-ACP methyl ester carboxylesterase
MSWFTAAAAAAGATSPSHGPRARGSRPFPDGLGEREHLFRSGVDLDCHITDIVNLLHFEDLRDAILVGHSYGGMVITGAADRAIDRVGHLVYLDAATPANGQTLADQAPAMMAAARAESRMVDGVEMCLYPTDDTLRLANGESGHVIPGVRMLT